MVTWTVAHRRSARRAMVASLYVAIAFACLGGAAPAVAQPANSPWPMFQHDARRTGKSGVSGPSSRAVTLKWTYKARNWIKVQVAIGDGGIVYIGDSKFPLCALPPERLSSGRPLWCTDDGGFVNASSPAVGNPFSSGGQTVQRVHIGERNNVFWSFNGTTGADLWHYKIPLDGDIHSSPLIAADGTVYMACGCVIAASAPNVPVGALYAFDASPP